MGAVGEPAEREPGEGNGLGGMLAGRLGRTQLALGGARIRSSPSTSGGMSSVTAFHTWS